MGFEEVLSLGYRAKGICGDWSSIHGITPPDAKIMSSQLIRFVCRVLPCTIPAYANLLEKKREVFYGAIRISNSYLRNIVSFDLETTIFSYGFVNRSLEDRAS